MEDIKSVISIDGVKLTPASNEEIHNYLIKLLNLRNKSCQITYLNAYVYCLARRHKELNSIISDSELVLADGISIVWATILINRIRVSRSIMTKVFDDFLISPDLPDCEGIILGATETEVKTAQKKINEISKKVNIVNAYSGYKDNQYYSEVLKEHRNIDLVLIGMGSPKSEYLCKLARGICRNSLIWHIGGGTINCYAGTKRRAPEWTSKMGIEWIQRFIFEKHTRKRYLIYNMVFLYFIAGGFFKSLYNCILRKNQYTV